MATRIMMALGSYRFSMDTAAYQEFRRQTSYRWTEQDRVGPRPRPCSSWDRARRP